MRVTYYIMMQQVHRGNNTETYMVIVIMQLIRARNPLMFVNIYDIRENPPTN